MSVTERQRHELHEWVKQFGNEEVAATLMELVPPVGWADVVTKRDLDHLGAGLRAELSVVQSELRTELRSGLSDVRSELRTGMAELRTEMAELRTEMAEVRTEMAEVRVSMSALETRLHRELRLHSYGVLGSIWASLGVALAVLG